MNQHFVPRVYLKRFAVKRGDAYYVDVYDKKTNKIFNTNIINICAEKDLYTLAENSGVSQDQLAIEKLYAVGFEPMYDRIFNILTDDTIFDITDLQRIEILLGIFQLYMRNPRILRISIAHHTVLIKGLIQAAKRRFEKGITYLDEDFSFSEWDEKGIIDYFNTKVTNAFKEGHVTGIGELGTFHEFSKLEVSKNKGPASFFTSDNPLVLEDLVEKQNSNPMQKTKEFVIALSHEYSLKIYHDNEFNLNTILRPIIPNGNTASTNHTIFNQASRFIIGKKEAFEEFFKIAELLDDTTFERKVHLIRQVVSRFSNSKRNDKMYQLMKHYLTLYDQNGGLTYEEEQDYYKQHIALTADWKKARI